MSQPLPLQARVEAASRMALKSRQFYSLYFFTKGEAGHRAHRRVINEFFEVIRFLQAACRDAALIELHSLFHDRRDTVNLPRLIREVEAGGVRMASSREVLASIAKHLPKLKLLRDKALAHRTRDSEFNDVFSAANITHEEVSTTIDAAVSIVNELRKACGLETQEISPLPLEVYDRMLTALRSDA